MSKLSVKTKYKVEDHYGTESEETLYAVHNSCSDYVSVYDTYGNLMFSYNDTIRDGLLSAINRVTNPCKTTTGELIDRVDYMDVTDYALCKL